MDFDGKFTLTEEDEEFLNSWYSGYNLNSTVGNGCCDGGDVCSQDDSMRFKSVFIPTLYSITFAVGLLGNGVLLGVLVQSRKTWSVTDTFILHLGVADVLLLVTLPLWAAEATLDGGWNFGTPLCKITGALFTINFYCGIFLLACISLDRYLSIVHATQMYSRRNPSVIQVSCLCVWLFSVILSIPEWIFFEATYDDRRSRKVCVRNYFKFGGDSVGTWGLAVRLLSHTMGFLLPSAVLIFCYSRILYRLRFVSRSLQKQRAFRVIVAVVVVFFLCWTPYNIMLMVDTLLSNSSSETCGVRDSLMKASVITSSVGYLHCSLNPILYAFVGVKFRRQLVDILRSLGCRLKTSSTFKSAVSSRRSSMCSAGSNSIAI